MVSVLNSGSDPRIAARTAFAAALDTMDCARGIALLGHFDADGLSALAILARALDGAGIANDVLVTAKGETPWDDTVRARLTALNRGGLVVTDLGVRAEPILDLPTIYLDHHRPTGFPPSATVISGHGLDPEPTSALLAWWSVAALGDASDLQWLAALGIIGDMAPDFPELTEAQARWGKTALKDAVALVNAPRRTAGADPSPALRLLLEGDGPKAITKGDGPDAEALRGAKAEVAAEMEAARKVGPKVRGDVALIRFHSPCQIHPLIAQSWRGRLKDKIVLAANTGYNPGWVHFAARSATGTDLLDFLARHRPPNADGRYGNGHAQATGGALRPADWNAFVQSIGFPEQQVPA